MGLVRFVHPSHGGRTIRYRHVADERWHLSKAELGVLAVLVLRGPQTAGEVRSRVRLTEESGTVEEILDMLAARSPDAFAVHLERRPGERESRWAHALCGMPDPGEPPPAPVAQEPAAASPDLARDVAELWLRVERLEQLLGLTEDVSSCVASLKSRRAGCSCSSARRSGLGRRGRRGRGASRSGGSGPRCGP